MSNLKKYPLLFALLYFLVPAQGFTQSLPDHFGAKGALQDPSISVEEALIYAMQDEAYAQAKYSAITDHYGTTIRPFNKVKFDKQISIQELLTLFKKYDVPLPEDNVEQYVTLPSSIHIAFEESIQKEKENIAMYSLLLEKNDLPPDLKTVFFHIREVSYTHLEVFKRGLYLNSLNQ